jgi:non-heme chloroperoxidase
MLVESANIKLVADTKVQLSSGAASGVILSFRSPGSEVDVEHYTNGDAGMSTITTKDGTTIYYKDWGQGQPLCFHHGWPLSADDWDAQMMFFLERGFRVIAHDRRGHGRSTQTDAGNEMDTYAADVNELVLKLDLRAAIHIGHSTGGGEVARYVARYGQPKAASRVQC